MQTLKLVSSFPQVHSRSHALRGNAVKGALRRESRFAGSQAPAWGFSAGSSSFPSREARASLTGFPSWSLGTSDQSDQRNDNAGAIK